MSSIKYSVKTMYKTTQSRINSNTPTNDYHHSPGGGRPIDLPVDFVQQLLFVNDLIRL